MAESHRELLHVLHLEDAVRFEQINDLSVAPNSGDSHGCLVSLIVSEVVTQVYLLWVEILVVQ